MERKTICDGLRKHFWSAASASAHLRLLPLLVAAYCAWLPAAQAEGACNKDDWHWGMLPFLQIKP